MSDLSLTTSPSNKGNCPGNNRSEYGWQVDILETAALIVLMAQIGSLCLRNLHVGIIDRIF
jgi:hypothetical protein